MTAFIRAFPASRHGLHTGIRRPIRTSGRLGKAEHAWVYVGVSPRGRVKVGMSEDPDRRCAAMKIRLFDAVEVVPAAAKEVETEALRILGHKVHDGEWTERSPEEAIAAVRLAVEAVARCRRVHPDLTEEESRARRVLLAAGGEIG